MVLALQQRLEAQYYLPVPVWLNTPVSKFWGPLNISMMFGQAVRRFAQVLAHGKPDVILDCSGYQYGDPWVAMANVLSLRMLMYQFFRGRGSKIVMLPQSLGPFRERQIASVAAGTLQLADLVFTRGAVSRQYALDLGCPPSRVRIAPDYSNLVSPQMPDNPDEWSSRVCVVPSIRMVDKTLPEVGTVYMAAMRKCINSIWNQGFEPCILVHQREDRSLAEALRKSISRRPRVVDPPPLQAKGILASCRAVVGSRYHALVGALSQGTPALGTGWTHKYRALFQDYSCEECLVERFDSETELEERLHLITKGASRDCLVDTLQAGARAHRTRSLAMFTELERMLAGESPLDTSSAHA